MKKYTYTDTQPFSGTIAGKDVLLGKGDTVELDETNDAVKVLIASKLLEAVKAPGNNNPKPENP